MEIIPRFFRVPSQSFFLFGPRGTGKSTWLRHELPDALFVDLLRPEVHRELSAHPERLRELVLGSPDCDTVVVDEVQRVPELLNVVHDLMSKPVFPRFVLAGRALLCTLHPFMAGELENFHVARALHQGLLPLAVASPYPDDVLKAYASLYTDYPECYPCLLYRGDERLKIGGIWCLPVGEFLHRLHPSQRLNDWLGRRDDSNSMSISPSS